MTPVSEREFEPFVREAMQARPQPRSISNLAFRAMELAREQARVMASRQLNALVRLRRRAMWVGMVATILIAVVVWAGVRKLSETGVIGTTITASTATTTSDQSTSDSSSSSSNGAAFSPALVVTAELLVVAMILLSAGIASPRPEGGEAIF